MPKCSPPPSPLHSYPILLLPPALHSLVPGGVALVTDACGNPLAFLLVLLEDALLLMLYGMFATLALIHSDWATGLP